MSILIIIGIIMFILALLNWSQSQGYFERLFSSFKGKISSGESSMDSAVSGSGVTGAAGVSGVTLGSGGIMINNTAFDLDEDYAYDDDLDYFGEF